ncbi:probable phosphatase 2C 50 isoform X1 [Olea europaea subsp. europaea]|uniref:protein-serine/threonine phosphatase n=1 Tax=Olea europaea subsp. europaea TaxID=158383 RepID=A0A8S0Q2Y2_OLEEU|nr:probable phosphatase 2C 50 isoform X1 [Olea europaea subsp. europaea]
MTKLPLVPLAHENRGISSSVPQSRLGINIESIYDKFQEGEGNLLSRARKGGTCLIASDAISQEGKEDDPVALTSDQFRDSISSQYVSNGTSSLCIRECAALETDSETIAAVSLDENGDIAHGIKKLVSWESNMKSEIINDLVSIEENCEALGIDASKRTFSASLLEVSEEVKTNLNFPPLWGFTSVRGRRLEMEDTVIALPWFLSIPSQLLTDIPVMNVKHQDLKAHFFGVYDGHGGRQVAEYCRKRIHLALAEEINIAKENWHNGIDDYCNQEEQWMKIFLNCFRKVDDEVGGFHGGDGESAMVEPVAPEAVGSTAVVAIVCPTHIIVANCGDSRAVLCRGKAPMPLSVDHKPNREDEYLRIEAAGGKVINWEGYRVCAMLAVSRSIGDRFLRPYVIADPEIMFVPRAKEDDCLVLATDGLWDVMTNEEACDLARRRILLWHKKNGPALSKERGEEVDPAAQDAAEYLSKLAFRRGSTDNISVIVVDLKAQRKFKKKS